MEIKKETEIEKYKEIERKFLVKNIPADLEKYLREEIEQGYLNINSDGSELRLRKMGDRYFKTFKKGIGAVRTEIEEEITKDEFKNLWPSTEGKRLEKTRYKIPYLGLLIELDVYGGKLDGFVSVEVEFESVEQSRSFVAPEWFGEEITENKKYKNQNLAVKGLVG